MMGKNIVICSDGTWQRGGKTPSSNVWRIFQAVDRHSNSSEGGPKQLTYYDDGVGTQRLRWLSLLGGAFGWGLSRDVRQAYAFLCLNFEPGDHVYLFGFSRGAFTVRSLAGMLLDIGLLERDALLNAAHNREKILKKLLRAHRSTPEKSRRKGKGRWNKARQKRLRKAYELGGFEPEDLRNHIKIRCIGVWDTVDAVGVPFDELKGLIQFVSRQLFRLRAWQFADYELHKSVEHAYQALALDEERKTFLPAIWKTEPGNDCYCDERIEQVWFAGTHSNVGGGNPKDALALVTLDWMMQKVAACGLRFTPGKLEDAQADADAHGKIHDSRAGLGAFYRYAQRQPYCKSGGDCDERQLPRVHVSVIRRTLRRTTYYASRVLEPSVSRKAPQDEKKPPVKSAVVGTRTGPFVLREDENYDNDPND